MPPFDVRRLIILPPHSKTWKSISRKILGVGKRRTQRERNRDGKKERKRERMGRGTEHEHLRGKSSHEEGNVPSRTLSRNFVLVTESPEEKDLERARCSNCVIMRKVCDALQAGKDFRIISKLLLYIKFFFYTHSNDLSGALQFVLSHRIAYIITLSLSFLRACSYVSGRVIDRINFYCIGKEYLGSRIMEILL